METGGPRSEAVHVTAGELLNSQKTPKRIMIKLREASIAKDCVASKAARYPGVVFSAQTVMPA